MISRLDGIQRLARVADTDAAWALEIAALIGPRLREVAGRFHGGRLANAEVAAALGRGPAAERTRLLTDWVRQALEGPHGRGYCEARWTCGAELIDPDAPAWRVALAVRTLVRELESEVGEVLAERPTEHGPAARALQALFDRELAILLEVHRASADVRYARSADRDGDAERHDLLASALGTIGTSVLLLRRQLGDDSPSAELLERLERQARVCASMAEQLRGDGFDSANALEPDEIRRQVRRAIAAAGVHVAGDIDEVLGQVAPVRASAPLLRQALVCLLSAAAARGGDRSQPVHVAHDATDDGVEVSVVSSTAAPRVESAAAETSLALARHVAELLHGAVEVRRGPDGDEALTLRLPAATDAARPLPHGRRGDERPDAEAG